MRRRNAWRAVESSRAREKTATHWRCVHLHGMGIRGLDSNACHGARVRAETYAVICSFADAPPGADATAA
eukprot:7060328-Pyramimonas_sp.AAC.1